MPVERSRLAEELKRLATNIIEETDKSNGKVSITKSTVSADGKTITSVVSNKLVGTTEVCRCCRCWGCRSSAEQQRAIMSLLPGSPATDAGNPSGWTDGQGHLLKTDQRSFPRPDKEDSGRCDMGAYEKQSD